MAWNMAYVDHCRSNYVHGVALQSMAGVMSLKKGHETVRRDQTTTEWFDGRIVDNGYRRNDEQTGVFDENANESLKREDENTLRGIVRGATIRAKIMKATNDPYNSYTLTGVEVVTM